jgi:DNA-binding CsgD family transcriptional regulator
MVTDPGGDGLVGRSTEFRVLTELARALQDGRGGALVVRGEPGIGKSALIERLVRSSPGPHTVRATGVESEMELAFAGLHQLCGPLLDLLPKLPGPQQDALSTVFGVREGNPPDRLLVGLAALSLLCEAAAQRPLLCVVDDGQWLDRASAQALAFVGRRLLADPIALVISTRGVEAEFSGLPELVLTGLGATDAMELLRSVPGAPLDHQVRDRIVAEAHGNPLALLEWHRTLTPAEAAGRLWLPAGGPLSGRLEESFRRRLAVLPAETQQFLLVAAAEPVGDATLVWQAAGRLGVGTQAVLPAVEAELVEVGITVRFSHPLVRSATYNSASVAERRAAHEALAEVMGADVDPDRRSWHRALAVAGPDEEVAEELEGSAGRAQGRGGVAAAAAFLERSAALSLDPEQQARRTISAASAHLEAGAFETTSALLAAVEAGTVDELHRAQVEILRGEVASVWGHMGDAAALYLSGARRLEGIDARLARSAYLSALVAAEVVGDLARGATALDVAQAARLAPVRPGPPHLQDLLLGGQALAHIEGPAAAAPLWREALEAVGAVRLSPRGVWLLGYLQGAAALLWDYDAHHALGSRFLDAAREMGGLRMLPWALDAFALVHVWGGDLAAATVLVGEMQSVIDAIGFTNAPWSPIALAAWRGHEAEAKSAIAAGVEQALPGGQGGTIQMFRSSEATLCNGLGRYEDALVAAERATSWRPHIATNLTLIETVEAGARARRPEVAAEAVERLSESTQASGTDWALGVEARCRALLSTGNGAEGLYLEAIERLDGSAVRPEAARAHLLFGEWLRRDNRRVEARGHLRTAYDQLSALGMDGFAERASRELSATGETVRKRSADTMLDLTPQEAQIAKLAADGRSNPEIGAQLFLSARTVEWHLRKVFTKMDVTSRKQLRESLAQRSASVKAGI